MIRILKKELKRKKAPHQPKEKKERHGDVFVIPTSKKESKNLIVVLYFYILF